VFAALSALASLVSPSRAESQARLSVSTGEVPPRLAARVALAIGREWGVDSSGLVLSWGTGSLAQVPDSSAFRLVGGEGGWLSLLVEPAKGAAVWIRLRAGITVDQAIAVRALPAGTVLGPDDMRVEPRLRWGPPAPDAARQAETGWVVKRPVAGGDALEGWRVAPPPVVSAGKPVRMLWNEGNVSVALEGVALNDAALGQPVRVRTSGRVGVVAGTAIAPGQARMN
jgi:flagella basal body P-ring formation protein FlgA